MERAWVSVQISKQKIRALSRLKVPSAVRSSLPAPPAPRTLAAVRGPLPLFKSLLPLCGAPPTLQKAPPTLWGPLPLFSRGSSYCWCLFMAIVLWSALRLSYVDQGSCWPSQKLNGNSSALYPGANSVGPKVYQQKGELFKKELQSYNSKIRFKEHLFRRKQITASHRFLKADKYHI